MRNLIGRNISFNLVSQVYIGFIGILTLPLYLGYLEAEAYGLLGFFLVLQSWMQLLDLGMSPTLGREIARLKGDAAYAQQLRVTIRSVELLFLGVAILAASSLFIGRGWWVDNWLQLDVLAPDDAALCFALIAPIIGLRLTTSLHRSGINGFECQVWMSLCNICFASLRFPGALLLIIVSQGNIILFFVYQLVLGILEQLVISLKLYALLPRIDGKVGFSFEELQRIAPFALGVAYTGGIWILMTQLDRLLLAKVLPLSEYGYFSLIVAISSGLMLLSGPVSNAILPRMTALLAEGRDVEMITIYRLATRFVVCMAVPLVTVLAVYPGEAVYVWTGSAEAALWAAPVMPLFIIGGGLLAVSSFQYYLQYAHGKLRQHVIYNTLMLIISMPLIIYVVFQYGVLGVAWLWIGLRVVALVIWTPYVHHLFAPGLHRRWMLQDVFFPTVVAGLVIALMVQVIGEVAVESRVTGFLYFLSFAVTGSAVALVVSFWPYRGRVNGNF